MKKIIIAYIIFIILVIMDKIVFPKEIKLSEKEKEKIEQIYKEGLEYQLSYLNKKENYLDKTMSSQSLSQKEKEEIFLKELLRLEELMLTARRVSDEEYSIIIMESSDSPEKEFTRKIYNRLRDKGIECYLKRTINSFYMTFKQTKLVELVYACEGHFELILDYNYIYEKYKSYLSKPTKEYLIHKTKVYKGLNHSTFWCDGICNATNTQLAEWLVDYSNFIKEYPFFPLKSHIEEDVDLYDMGFNILNIFPDETGNYLDSSYKEALLYIINNTSKGISKEYKAKYKILKEKNFYIDEFYDVENLWKE